MAAAKPRSISKSEILKTLAESTELSKKQIASVLEAIANLVGKNIGKKGPGVIALPGLVKIKVVNKPPQPARKGVMVLGQLRDLPAKPASRKVRVMTVKGLKAMEKEPNTITGRSVLESDGDGPAGTGGPPQFSVGREGLTSDRSGS